MINCTFVNNGAGGGGWGGLGQIWSGNGGDGGDGGGVYAFTNLIMRGCTVVSNTAGPGGSSESEGGNTGTGGNGGGGGGIYSGGLTLLTNCTIAANCGGAGGNSDWGVAGAGGDGGGIFSSFMNVTIAACTIASNSAGMGGMSFGMDGSSGGICAATNGGGVLINTILADNSPDNDNGSFADGGHNLISSAALELGPLADNGGPTLTMALLPGSPAIDAGTAVGAPATDQRGVPRTQGTAPDIGAFEYLYTPVFTGVTLQNTTNRQLQMSGFTPDQTLTLQASTNLLDWFDFTNIVGGANGAFQCFIPVSTPAPQHDFFRLKSDSP
jgi:hypothetical protein